MDARLAIEWRMESTSAEYWVCDQWRSDKKDDIMDLSNGRKEEEADLKGYNKYSISNVSL